MDYPGKLGGGKGWMDVKCEFPVWACVQDVIGDGRRYEVFVKKAGLWAGLGLRVEEISSRVMSYFLSSLHLNDSY